MNKARVEAFTDAVIAIILTIMVLELHIPASDRWQAMLENWPDFFAYTVSFIFIGAAWYNHHYMLSVTQYFSKRAYWVNNFWLFTMSMIPVSTGWVGAHLMSPDPEWFYYLVYGFWTIAYFWLSAQIEKDARTKGQRDAERIHTMSAFNSLRQPWLIGLYFVGFVVIKFWPPFALLATLFFGVSMATRTSSDSDQLFS